MNKKKVILSILLAVVAIANVVLYLIFKEQYLDTLKYIYGLLNEPLPIVGITSLAVLIFLWRVIIAARYGQGNLNKIKAEYEQEKQELLKQINQYKDLLNNQNLKIDNLENYIVQLCEIIPNKKVKELGEGLKDGKGKETVNRNTEKE